MFVLTGCAAFSDAECRSTNWYDVGRRDGEVYGAQPMIDQYLQRCRAHGVQPDAPSYIAGWKDGNIEFRQRMDSGGTD